jgi:hypothetical protein
MYSQPAFEPHQATTSELEWRSGDGQTGRSLNARATGFWSGRRHRHSTSETRLTASRSARRSRLQGDRSASLGSGGDGWFAGLAPATLARSAVRGRGPGLAATLLQRLAHARQLQVAVVLLGDIELLGRAIWVADRQLIGLTGRDLGLVEVRNIHRDRLGSHRNSLLGRSALEAERHHFGQTNNSGRGNVTAAEISFRPILPPTCRPVPACTSGRLTGHHGIPAEPDRPVGDHPCHASYRSSIAAAPSARDSGQAYAPARARQPLRMHGIEKPLSPIINKASPRRTSG